jgi:hypothetical protein
MSPSYYAGMGNGPTPNFGGGSGAGSIAKIIAIDPNNSGNSDQAFNGQSGGLSQNDINAAQGGSYDQRGQFFDPYSAFGNQANGSYGFNNFIDNSSNAMPGGGQGIPYMNAPFSAGSNFGGDYFGGSNFGGSSFNNNGTFDASGQGFNANDYTSGNFDNAAIPQYNFGSSGGGGNYNSANYYGASGNTSPFVDTSSNAMPTGGDYTTYSQPSGGNYSFGGGYGGYARGGPAGIPMPASMPGSMPGATTGGKVPMQASPSRGQQTDDVSARLNAGEFVVPKDVAAWKGHEFFQKLIAQSRKARMQGHAKPQMKKPLPNQNRPTFVSRPMNQGAGP